jgi:hypothetical protein
MLNKPTVSLIMPTRNRARYIPIAMRCFLQQSYPIAELIIVDDGTETFFMPTGLNIRYVKTTATTTGAKRNIGAELATGDIIANWDDDDWSHPHRIEDEIQRLITTGKAVTGYNASIIFEEATGLLYRIPAGPPYFASGSSQCYWKSWWREHPYPDCSFGEDSAFSRTARLADQLAIAEPGHMLMVRRHSTNTSDVYLGKLPRLSTSDVSPDFFRALSLATPTLEYVTEEHQCDAACKSEAARQYLSPVVDYRVSKLPEVPTR